MLLSVVILHTNKPRDAEACLRSLATAQLPADTEIFVINNGGHQANDQIDPIVIRQTNAQQIDLPRDGYIYGNNQGYERATGRFIATVNADITVKVDTLMMLVRYLEKHPKTGLITPRLIYPSGKEQENVRNFPRIRDLAFHRLFGLQPTPALTRNERDGAVEVDWFTGALFVMSRACYRQIGGHDERYYLFMSDVALCREAWVAGFEVRLLRTVRATHNHIRLSQGNLWTMLRRPTGRAHIKDAWAYFLHYCTRPLPPLCPSKQH